nr:hypothetical protein [Bacteroides intestinalis]
MIAIVNGVMRGVLCANDIIRIEYTWVVVDNILIGYWVDMMNNDRTKDFKSINTQVASIVTKDNLITKSLPFS